MRARSGRSLLPALVLLGLVGVVAVAATGSTPVGTADGRPPSETVLDTFFSLALVLLVIGAALFVYGLLQRRAIAEQIASGRYPRSSLLAWTIFASLLTIAVWFGYGSWSPPRRDAPVVDIGAGDRRVDEPGNALTDTADYRAEFAWIPVLAVVALALVAAAAWALAARRRRDSREDDDRALAVELAGALDDSLDDLRAEPDPRRAVIAAFARLESTLTAAGVPRAGSETADEYVARVLGRLVVDAEAIGRLGALFDRAKFSQHRIDPAMKDDAIEALVRVRDELREAARRAREAELAALEDRVAAT